MTNWKIPWLSFEMQMTPGTASLLLSFQKASIRRRFCSIVQHHPIRSKMISAATASFSRTKFDELMKRKFFYAPSFSIYGGNQ